MFGVEAVASGVPASLETVVVLCLAPAVVEPLYPGVVFPGSPGVAESNGKS